MSTTTETTFAPGFYPGVREQDYLSGAFGPPEGSLSASGIKTLLKAPALYRHEREHPREETDAMRLGTVVHELILGTGPGYIVLPPTSRKKVDQEAKAEAVAGAVAEGKAYVTEEQHANARGAAEAVLRDPAAHRLLTGCEWDAELTAYAFDLETGIWRRCRYDALRTDDLGIDVKTARAASPGAFARACHDLGYHISAAYYTDIAESLGRPLTDYAFLVVEPFAPYLVGVYKLDEDSIDLGRRRYREGIQRYRDCLEADIWPGYLVPEDHTISLPGYAFRETA